MSQEVGFRFFRTMKWGFNRRLDPQEIQVVPMVTPSSMLFLDWALRGRNELKLRVMYGLKRALRLPFSRWSPGDILSLAHRRSSAT